MLLRVLLHTMSGEGGMEGVERRCRRGGGEAVQVTNGEKKEVMQTESMMQKLIVRYGKK